MFSRKSAFSKMTETEWSLIQHSAVKETKMEYKKEALALPTPQLAELLLPPALALLLSRDTISSALIYYSL